jgi:hypothetical protein
MLKLWLGWWAGGGGGQYPPGSDGGHYLARGGSGRYIKVCPTAGDPPHGIMGVGLILEPCNLKV